MGYMRHHTIVVTCYDQKRLEAAHGEADRLHMAISEIVASPVNGYCSFFVAPDGSKEGWDESEAGDTKRDDFIRWLDEQRFSDGSSPYDWVEVQYGDDNRETLIVREKDSMPPKIPATPLET